MSKIRNWWNYDNIIFTKEDKKAFFTVLEQLPTGFSNHLGCCFKMKTSQGNLVWVSTTEIFKTLKSKKHFARRCKENNEMQPFESEVHSNGGISFVSCNAEDGNYFTFGESRKLKNEVSAFVFDNQKILELKFLRISGTDDYELDSSSSSKASSSFDLSRAVGSPVIVPVDKPGRNQVIGVLDVNNEDGSLHPVFFNSHTFKIGNAYKTQVETVQPTQQGPTDVIPTRSQASLTNQATGPRVFDIDYNSDTRSGDKIQEGKDHSRLARTSLLDREYNDAVMHANKWLAIARETGDQLEENEAYEILGNAHLSLGNNNKAIEHFEKYLEIENTNVLSASKRRVFETLENIYYTLGKYTKVVELYEMFSSISVKLGDNEKEADAYEILGKTYQSLGFYDKAVECHLKTVSIAVNNNDQERECAALRNLGNAHKSLSRYDKAIECYDNSLTIASELGNRQAEVTAYGSLGTTYQLLGNQHKAEEFIQKQLDIAVKIRDRKAEGMAYGNLGNYFASLGKYHKAIESIKEQMKIASQTNDTEAEAVASGNLGNLYELVGKYKEAMTCYEIQLCVYNRLRDRHGEGNAYGSLGKVHMNLGDNDRAMPYCLKHLAIAKSLGDKKEESTAYRNVGNALASLKENDKAIECFQKSLKIAEEIGDKQGEGNAYDRLGNVYQLTHNYSEAKKYHEKHLSIATDRCDKQGEGEAHYNIGICLYKGAPLNNPKSSDHLRRCEKHLLKSRQCYEELLENLRDETELKISIADIFTKVHKSLAEFYIETDRIEKSILESERGKARVLGNVLSTKHSLDLDYSLELADGVLINACIVFYDIDIRKTTVRIWLLDSEKPPFITSSEINMRHVTYPSWRDPESSLLRSAILDLDDDDDEFVLENYCDLYSTLIAPIKHKLDNREIIIIPDGPLFMVSFAALQDPFTKKFLMETNTIRFAPSMKVMKILHEVSARDPKHESKAIVFGNPEIGRALYEGKVRAFTPLPGAELEAIAIGNLLGVKPLVGNQATKKALLGHLQSFSSVIHISTHGFEDKLLLAPVLSAPGNIPEEEDYVLSIEDVLKTNVEARLVVLSCCHSGRGEIKSEGVVGMTRAFLAAGARAVVAAIWQLEDYATAEFMYHFYSHLKSGVSASKSLQQAMNAMKQIEKYKEPRYWGGFFVIGDDVTFDMHSTV